MFHLCFQLLNSLNEVASFCLTSILTSIFKWRDMEVRREGMRGEEGEGKREREREREKEREKEREREREKERDTLFTAPQPTFSN